MIAFIIMAVVVMVVLAVSLGALVGFLLMLSMGIIHSYVPAWPALNFLESWVIAATLLAIFGNTSFSKKDD